MLYPNRVIIRGETDKQIVKTLQQQINAKGCGPIDIDGDFGDQTFRAVKLFQTRHTDTFGNPLVADGKIGSITWGVLFGSDSISISAATTSPVLKKALEIAASQIGVKEEPPFSNRGPMVDQYIRAAGLNPEGQHYSWCMAFVYWCFNEAAKSLGRVNPTIKTAGCLDHWRRATCPKILKADAIANPSLVKPGFIFIIDHGGGNGHTGIVESVNGGFVTTIEGNTNNDGSANGFGVLRLTTRKIASINKGFLDYSNN